MEPNQITNLLTVLLGIFIFILFILIFAYILVLTKTRKINSYKEGKKEGKEKSNNKKNTSGSLKSIYDFMEFDDVQDNMIIQKENHKYIMVVECQGVNYDLMSEIEKNGVEEGFLQL